MKKLAIISSAAALAAMPMVGVFADGEPNATDVVTVTVDTSCTLSKSGEQQLAEKTMQNNTTDKIDGTEFEISCNDGTGWHLTAQGTGGISDKATSMVNGEETHRIWTIDQSGNPSTEHDSYWGVEITASGDVNNKTSNVTVASGYSDTSWGGPIPDNGTTTVVSAQDTSYKAIIKPIYHVHVGGELPNGTYTGKVTYTLFKGQE